MEPLTKTERALYCLLLWSSLFVGGGLLLKLVGATLLLIHLVLSFILKGP
jgi:hypothetical protein